MVHICISFFPHWQTWSRGTYNWGHACSIVLCKSKRRMAKVNQVGQVGQVNHVHQKEKTKTQIRLGMSEEDGYFFGVPNVDDRKHKDKQSKCRVRPLCHLLSQGTSLLDPTEVATQSLATFGTVRHSAAQGISQFITFFFFPGMSLRTITLKESTGTGACAWLNRRTSQCSLPFFSVPTFSTSPIQWVPEPSQNSLFPLSKLREMAKAVKYTLVRALPSCFVGACMQNYSESERPWNLPTFLCLFPSLFAFVVFQHCLHIFFHRLSRPHPMKRYLPVHFFSQPWTPNGALCDTFSEARKRAWVTLNSHWSRGVGICQWDELTKLLQNGIAFGVIQFLRLCLLVYGVVRRIAAPSVFLCDPLPKRNNSPMFWAVLIQHGCRLLKQTQPHNKPEMSNCPSPQHNTTQIDIKT